jgi:hypothetical protein
LDGYPGSLHDATCFSKTDLYRNPEKYFSNGEYLLADGGYTLTQNQIVPYRNPQGEQSEFNMEFSSARIIVEHVMGLLKGRWGSLRGLRIQIHKKEDIERVNRWIVAVLILHNMVMKFNDNWEGEMIDEELEQDQEVEENLNETGTQMRERLKEVLLGTI